MLNRIMGGEREMDNFFTKMEVESFEWSYLPALSNEIYVERHDNHTYDAMSRNPYLNQDTVLLI